MPNIGYRNNKKTRYKGRNGKYEFLVMCPKVVLGCVMSQDLELLLMHNNKYCAVMASTLSIRKRKLILDRAAQLNIKVVNAKAKMITEENE